MLCIFNLTMANNQQMLFNITLRPPSSSSSSPSSSPFCNTKDYILSLPLLSHIFSVCIHTWTNSTKICCYLVRPLILVPLEKLKINAKDERKITLNSFLLLIRFVFSSSVILQMNSGKISFASTMVVCNIKKMKIKIKIKMFQL